MLWFNGKLLAMVCVVSALAASLVLAAPVPKDDPKTRKADALQRIKSKNNLKQIVLAMHNYHDVTGQFPSNICDKDGKPLLSWRVHLLPYLEENPLYEKFKLDEPWDSENNKPLLAKMPSVFRLDFQDKDDTKTYYQGFEGSGTLFEPGKKWKIIEITDGSSNTLAVVEAGPPVEWTRPADIPYDPKKKPKFETPFANVLIGATADGDTHSFKPDIDEKNLHYLIEIADGNAVSVDDHVANFPLSAEELDVMKKMIAANEKLFEELVTELKDHQKMLLEIAKNPNTKDATKRLDDVLRMNEKLKEMIADLKRENEELKKLIEQAKKAKPEK